MQAATKSHVGQTRAQRGGKQVIAHQAPPAKSADFRHIETSLVDSSKTNPRKDFGDLTGLAASIEQQGIIEPLIVRPKGKRFEIVAGERRYRAGKLVNLEKLPCIVRELSDADAIEIQGIENIQQANLREHWAIKQRRKIQQQQDTYLAMTAALRNRKIQLPCVITLTRIGARLLDTDNLANSFKAVQDAIAKRMGVDDGDSVKGALGV